MRINSITVGFNEVPNSVAVLLFAQGCSHGCNGCHNNDLWAFDGGEEYTDESIRSTLTRYVDMCDWVCWLGGDAVFQPDRLVKVNSICRELGFNIALYTGFTKDSISDTILDTVDMVVDGKWVEELGGVESDTTNQVTYIKENSTFKQVKFTDLNTQEYTC